MDDDEVQEKLAHAGARRVARLLGVPVEELRGVQLPGLGQFHAVSYDMEYGFWVYYHDSINSTCIVPLSKLTALIAAAGEEGARRALTRGTATLSGDTLSVETTAEVEGAMIASSDAEAREADRVVSSTSTARPVPDPDVQDDSEDA